MENTSSTPQQSGRAPPQQQRSGLVKSYPYSSIGDELPVDQSPAPKSADRGKANLHLTDDPITQLAQSTAVSDDLGKCIEELKLQVQGAKEGLKQAEADRDAAASKSAETRRVLAEGRIWEEFHARRREGRPAKGEYILRTRQEEDSMMDLFNTVSSQRDRFNQEANMLQKEVFRLSELLRQNHIDPNEGREDMA